MNLEEPGRTEPRRTEPRVTLWNPAEPRRTILQVAPRPEPRRQRGDHGVHRDPPHAAVIDGAVAQHAGTAEDPVNEHVVIAEGPCDAIVGRPEDRGNRDPDRGREMHGPG